jgi:hypothetical protein
MKLRPEQCAERLEPWTRGRCRVGHGFGKRPERVQATRGVVERGFADGRCRYDIIRSRGTLFPEADDGPTINSLWASKSVNSEHTESITYDRGKVEVFGQPVPAREEMTSCKPTSED